MIFCLIGQALGKLIRTIGSTLDSPLNRTYMKELFRLMDKIANNKTINSRMRFMIRDLEELRVGALISSRSAAFRELISLISHGSDTMQHASKKTLVAACVLLAPLRTSPPSDVSNSHQPW